MHTLTSNIRNQTLIERYVQTNDKDCFARIVQIHAVMVHRVCLRILKDEHLAEDATQDSFTLLARKAHTIRDSALLTNCLYGVAVRKSLELRRKQQHSLPLFEAEIPAQCADLNEQAEAVAVIDEELCEIPEKYRIVLVMHYFSGDTLRSISRTTGVPFGTLSSRLQRGRNLLRSRLSKRGLTLGALLLTISARSSEAADATMIGGIVEQAIRQTAGGSTLPSSPLGQATRPDTQITNAVSSATGPKELAGTEQKLRTVPDDHSTTGLAKSVAAVAIASLTVLAIWTITGSSINMNDQAQTDPVLSARIQVSHLELPVGDNGGADIAPFVRFQNPHDDIVVSSR